MSKQGKQEGSEKEGEMRVGKR